MGYCPKHRIGFREPADEQGDHGCPACRRTPTESEMARMAGYGNWVDQVEQLEAEVARLKSMLQEAFERIAKQSDALAAKARPPCDHVFKEREFGRSSKYITIRTYCIKCDMQHSDNLIEIPPA